MNKDDINYVDIINNDYTNDKYNIYNNDINVVNEYNNYKVEKPSSSDSLYVAKKFFDIYNYLKTREEIKEAYDPVEYLKELNKSHYIINGRPFTDEEIIAFEIHNIQSILINNDYSKSKYKDEINRLYSRLLKTKVLFKKEKMDVYMYTINYLCCLLDKMPPFLDQIYEICSRIDNRKYKVIRK